MRIDVVPLRKLPTDIAILSYEVDEPVIVGQLVAVPFRKKPLLAAVWNTQSKYDGVVQLVAEVFPNLVCNEIQRTVLDTLQSTHAISVASMLSQRLPANATVKKLDVPAVTTSAPITTATYIWYDDRAKAIVNAAEYIKETPDQIHCIVVPTEEHALEWQLQLPDAPILTSSTLDSQRNTIYKNISSGQVRIIIGTSELLFLPYPAWPNWVIDDEEHPSHKQSQAPFLDARRALDAFPGHQQWLSSAPTLRRWHAFRPTAPSSTTKRIIGRLDQGTNAPWISWEAEQAIRETAPGTSIVWLLPKNNFAVRYGCKRCGWSVSCHACGSAIRWSVEGATARCGFCQEQQTLPSQCGQCRQQGLQELGLNSALLRRSLEQLVPDRMSDMQFLPYHHHLPSNAGIIIHAGADALLQYNDVAAEDRAYQLIQEILSRTPQAQHVVQTHEPTFRLWQLWSLHQDTQWYEQLWQERSDLRVPPAQPGLLVRYRGLDPVNVVRAKKQELEQQLEKKFQVLILPIHQRSATQTPIHRMLITCSDHANPTTKLNWKTTFPAPWAVDMAPDSWLV